MAKIRKAVVPAAGLGTRLHPMTRGRPKEMLPIAGRPMIYYAILEAAICGLEHIYIVINKQKVSLRRYLESRTLKIDLQEDGKRKNIRAPHITFIDQPTPLGSGEAIYRTRNMIGQEPFALMMPDFILLNPSPALSQMMPVYERFERDVVGVVILGAREAEGFGNVGIFKPIQLEKGIVEVQAVSNKSRKPLILREGEAIHKAIGRCILLPHFFSYLERVKDGDQEWDDAPAFQFMCEERKIIGKTLEGTGFDVGNPVGYRMAKKAFEAP